MRSPRFFLPLAGLLVAAAMSPVFSRAEEEKLKDTAKPVNCLAEMNEVRSLVGFAPFTAESAKDRKLPIRAKEEAEEDEDWKAICDSIRQGGDSSALDDEYKQKGTWAFAPQSGDDANCAAGVAYWKDGFTNFDQLLSPYESDQKPPYDTPRRRSFVALFNPHEAATAECAYFTCPVTTASSTAKPPSSNTATTTTQPTTTVAPVTTPTVTATPSATPTSATTVTTSTTSEVSSVSSNNEAQARLAASPQSPTPKVTERSVSTRRSSGLTGEAAGKVTEDGPKGKKDSAEALPNKRRLEEVPETVKALVCVTYPKALNEGQSPFTQEQWNQLVTGLSSSAFTAAPAFLTIAASALAVALF